jgi:Uma2 family endonuclease
MATVVGKRRRRTRKLTEAEFMRLPDDGRKYELVDGEAKEVPTSLKHDVIGMRLAFSLMPHLSDKAYFTGAQAGYRMASGNIRVPDVGVILKQSLPDGKLPDGFGDRAPDLAIEIVSPTEDMPDLLRKVGEYFESGAQEVWLLFPETQRVVRYTAPFEAIICTPPTNLARRSRPTFACASGTCSRWSNHPTSCLPAPYSLPPRTAV